MKIQIVIPAHNEEKYLSQCLDSFVNQTIKPDKIIVVNDSSTDRTSEIIKKYESDFPFIKGIHFESENHHRPGAKVIRAFYAGYDFIDDDSDLIGKFDADLILPPDYFEKMVALFSSDKKVGIGSGILYIKEGSTWKFENISKKDKVRGPIKLYRKACFRAIGGLKKSIGWDTVDELLARYHGWKVKTIPSLQVKHLKPTGKVYGKTAKYKQGEAFYRMRYGLALTIIASAKLAWNKKDFKFFIDTLHGYFKARKKKKYLVTTEEGKFIRNFRWKNIFGKFNLFSK